MERVRIMEASMAKVVTMMPLAIRGNPLDVLIGSASAAGSNGSFSKNLCLLVIAVSR